MYATHFINLYLFINIASTYCLVKLSFCYVATYALCMFLLMYVCVHIYVVDTVHWCYLCLART